MPDGLSVPWGTIAAVCACIALGSCITRKIDNAELERVKAAHAQQIAAINKTAADAYATLLEQRNALGESINGLAQAYATEKGQHDKDNATFAAKLRAGAERVRVLVTGCNPSAASQGAGTSGRTDATPVVAELPGETAASVVAVADDADETARRLVALQAYVKELQAKGVVEK